MNNSFKRHDKPSIKDFNLEEARGWIINRLIQIESQINSIIIEYFQPEKKDKFKGVMLHTSIISTGGKLKILNGLDIINNKTSTNIQKLLSIRNAFAHSSVIPQISLVIDKEIKQPVQITSIDDMIEVMNSNGKINKNNARESLTEFWELDKEVGEILRNIELK